MKSDELIEHLASELTPVRPNLLGRRAVLGILIGSLGTLALIAGWLGFRPDLGLAMHGATFWVKWLYTFSIGLCALAATIRLARPDAGSLSWLWIVLVPVICLAAIGIAELAGTPTSQWLSMWLGHSWKVCSRNVLILSAPIFAGLLWSYRKFAPTRLRAAGATAGLAAGGWAATLYCLHCPEVSAIFVLTWYTLGIVLAAALGALLGPHLLRW